jgi:cyclase
MQTHYPDKWLKALLLSVLLPTAALADDGFSDVEIKTQKAGNGVYMLTGQGGNLGVSAGPDGVFLIDDQFAPLTEKIRTAIATLSDKPIRFVLNTHWHPDHTGGNENIGKGETVIMAHDNVRKRLSVDNFIEMFQMEAPAMGKAGLPVITFSDSLTLHLNNDEILVTHVENAHTDGDAIIVFKQANVIHAGDTYFAGMYPFIDSNSGGSVEGTLKAIRRILALADENTVIIPGHGPISNKSGLTAYSDMLETISNRIRTMINKQTSLQQIQAARPTQDYDETYGGGFIKNEAFVEMLYQDIARSRS